MKLESLKLEKFTPLTTTMMSHVRGGLGGESTAGGVQPGIGTKYASDCTETLQDGRRLVEMYDLDGSYIDCFYL